uniref:Cellulase n=1 Tax=uncultured bacterium contig00028 TaxID=1181517 RepID=A0A806KQ68_9BACT|nr:hypothetical protein [uncultured bacterium contig00028]
MRQRIFLFLTVFAGAVLFTCSNDADGGYLPAPSGYGYFPISSSSNGEEGPENSSSSENGGQSSSGYFIPGSSSTSSSSMLSSSATVACVVRTAGMPSNPTSACFRGEGSHAGKCYICPSDVNCTNPAFWSTWAWDNEWPSQGWLTEVSCGGGTTSSSSRASSSSGGTVTGDDSYTVKPGGVTKSNAKTTRYWDACKPSCAWTGNASSSPNGVARSCNVNGGTLTNNDAASSCGGGNAYTCMYQAPWAINSSLAFGFAASHSNGDCGKCFELTFITNGEGGMSGTITGKKMVVMVSNIGGDVDGDQYDIMIPGGGVGAFNALSNQISQNGGPASPNLGIQYGGFRGSCGNDVSCIQTMCNNAFSSSGLADLKAGCQWFIDWYGISNNPRVNSVEVNCPQSLINKYNKR